MTKAVKISVRNNIDEQMLILEQMVKEIRSLCASPVYKTDPSLRKLAQEMAANLKRLSEKVLNVGRTVLTG